MSTATGPNLDEILASPEAKQARKQIAALNVRLADAQTAVDDARLERERVIRAVADGMATPIAVAKIDDQLTKLLSRAGTLRSERARAVDAFCKATGLAAEWDAVTAEARASIAACQTPLREAIDLQAVRKGQAERHRAGKPFLTSDQKEYDRRGDEHDRALADAVDDETFWRARLRRAGQQIAQCEAERLRVLQSLTGQFDHIAFHVRPTTDDVFGVQLNGDYYLLAAPCVATPVPAEVSERVQADYVDSGRLLIVT